MVSEQIDHLTDLLFRESTEVGQHLFEIGRGEVGPAVDFADFLLHLLLVHLEGDSVTACFDFGAYLFDHPFFDQAGQQGLQYFLIHSRPQLGAQFFLGKSGFQRIESMEIGEQFDNLPLDTLRLRERPASVGFPNRPPGVRRWKPDAAAVFSVFC